MSTLLKTTSKAASNAKNNKSRSKLPRSDILAAGEDMALEAGVAMSGEEDSEDEQDVDMFPEDDDEEDEDDEAADEVPVKKNGKADKGKGKESSSKKKTVALGEVDKVEKAQQRRKDKVLMLSSRGITGRMRHLMLDLEAILPHLKKDAKLDSKSSLHLVNELADLHSCNNTLYFEARRHEDLYLWLTRSPNGPSVKCHVQNIHTMDELKMTGNCLKGSRGLVCFDGGWDGDEQWKLLREMLTHTFSVPKSSRKLKPFIDHILSFSLLDNKIWFRNFQIVEKDPLQPSGPPVTSLVEIGPRFVLTPIRIFEGSFGGPTIFANPEFISPASARASFKRIQGQKYKQRKNVQSERDDRRTKQRDEMEEDELAVGRVFA